MHWQPLNDLPRAAVLTALTLTLAAAKCGGDGDAADAGAELDPVPSATAPVDVSGKTYTGDGYSFSYPSEWQQGSTAGGNPDLFTSYVAFGPGPPNERDGIEVKSVDPLFSLEDIEDAWSDAPGGYEELTDGPTRVTVDGLPAVRAEAKYTEPETGDEYAGMLVMVFDERMSHLLECQFGRERREEIAPGCEQVFASFQVD